MSKAKDAPKVAAQICHHFEVKVEMKDETTKNMREYAPMRMWTAEARKDAGFDSKQNSPFSMRCKLYVYIRTHLEVEPATCSLSLDDLREAAKIMNGEKDYFESAVQLAKDSIA